MPVCLTIVDVTNLSDNFFDDCVAFSVKFNKI